MGFWANSRVILSRILSRILILILPLPYYMALENILGKTRMDVFPSQFAGANR